MDPKVIIWALSSVSLSAISYLIYKFIVRTKQNRERENFSNPTYAIGAAIVNMERAIIHGDDENFKFFARYAIRASIGMARAYPPDEPPVDSVIGELKNLGADENLIAKATEIYSLGELPDNIEFLRNVAKDSENLVRAICKISKIGSANAESGDFDRCGVGHE